MEAEDLQVVVALTARLAEGEKTVGTLTPTEWDVVADAIIGRHRLPRHLRGDDAAELLSAIAEAGKRLTPERLSSLLLRFDHAGRRLHDWQVQGIQVLGRGSNGYPRTFRRLLGPTRPPLLWARGNIDLMNVPGVAIVGSRDAEYRLLRRATDLGAAVAAQGFTVVSGGARGIDERAVEGALMESGTAVVVLPDSLATQAAKAQFREYLEARRLALISPYSPDAGYQTGTAMGRNRLIYCLSRAAIVVRSNRHAGGTFAGAQQALKNGWTRVWVEPASDETSGNHILHERDGATWIPFDDLGPVWSSVRDDAATNTRSLREDSTSWTPFE
jgi:predicted Rossmann fold nucleotide-binding protein DprA/Smf involved in DNA uptake